MKVYRVEQCEYDYSPTIGIFDSLEAAIAYLQGLGAVGSDPVHKSWELKTQNYTNIYAINVSELNNPSVAEERV